MASRAKNFTVDELSILADELEKHSENLYGRLSNNLSKSDKENLWKGITESINAVGGNNRAVSQVTKKATKIRSEVKGKECDNINQMSKTGGGSAALNPLTEAEAKILRTIPPVSVYGVSDGIDTSNGNFLFAALNYFEMNRISFLIYF